MARFRHFDRGLIRKSLYSLVIFTIAFDFSYVSDESSLASFYRLTGMKRCVSPRSVSSFDLKIELIRKAIASLSMIQPPDAVSLSFQRILMYARGI
ncbi:MULTISPECIES: hypothetical protein [unclassified Ruegeria]|uniref:hypothetical protein n=1 Tax=unclassified Ruegeria TaxID=2625375 RepID=UPI0014890CEB|nr:MULTISPECIES: hypothetical protein [unclassified Ruegeria]NOD63862.1 hypothetical protein [Ruegeria sp. HKCCD6109]NOD76314.1 hypothetical protein [Ruegeria sp. HKCCD4332]NOD90269.1 hypothetical protein [Ruegeria sp. HKCCD4318]NOE15342.1 hypothetical protein [Ruegeria sp. HKCCD4318-2]NOG10448.1 hypothetical protein [Ruegeria sp. HKCCD4315]